MKIICKKFRSILVAQLFVFVILSSTGVTAQAQGELMEDLLVEDLLAFSATDEQDNDSKYVGGVNADVATYEVVYGNESGCDYKVIFQFQTTCTGGCNTSAGQIDASTPLSSFFYNTPLSGCSNTTACGKVRIINQTSTGSATTTYDCNGTEEQFTSINCSGDTYTIAVYECDQIRI